jgi:hypothetical protein
MRHVLIGLFMAGAAALSPAASAELSVSIGINVPTFPQLVRIPNYPVYYAPSMNANYFFYDGLYWVFDGDTWFQSDWYNGPWYAVDPYAIPAFLLRVPVRYYRARPAYFHGWSYDAPPRWGQHWGSSWESRHRGWDRWNRSATPAPAPLPTYQRSYSGGRYPNVTQQAVIQTRNYNYQPRETVSRQRFQERRAQARSAPQTATRDTWIRESQQRQERAQRAQVQQPGYAQQQPQVIRQERVRPAQAQPQQGYVPQQPPAIVQEGSPQAQAAQRRAERAQQRENRGERGRGHDKKDKSENG